MAKVIDVGDLPEEEVKLVREFIKFLKEKTKMRDRKTIGNEKIIFRTWPLGAKGRYTRKEIYNYL